ncbi:hypothetical protein VE00_07248 [Pseudogymnoascus sp. WSF 3629]|nr:hypothetical protein VE00_07248 [Pseudogymnoascus sp. WSF 3629]
MANRAGMPPPPPNHGFQQAPPGMVQGGPPVNRPQQAQQPRQPMYQQPQQPRQPMYQQDFQPGDPVPAYRPDTFINASTRIRDIRPEKTESASFCKKQLTTYEVFTILPSNDDDGKDSKGSKGKKDSKDKKKDNWSGWGGKDGKDKDDSKSKKRERWAKVTINQESYPTEQIINMIQKLDASKLSIAEKKAKLFPNQSTQVTNILDDKIKNERESNSFEWVLVQLHREESTNSKTGKKETTSMTIYLKRAPLPHLDVMQMYRERQERVRMQAFQRQQAQVFQQQQHQAAMQQQQHQAAMQQQQQQQQQQMGGGQYMPQNNKGTQQQQQQQKGGPWAQPVKNKNAPVKIVQEHRPGTPHKSPKGKPAGTKVRMNDSEGHSSGSNSETESDYDSEFSHYDSEGGTPHTSASSRSGGRKYPRSHRPIQRSRERHRSHYDRGDDFIMIDHPKRRGSLSYAPDSPRPDRPQGARVNGYGQPNPAIANPGIDAETLAMCVAAATRAAIAQPAIIQQPVAQYAAPPPPLMNSNVERAAIEDARVRDAEDIMRQDAMRAILAREDAARISRRDGRDFRNDGRDFRNDGHDFRNDGRDFRNEGGRGYALPARRYLDEDRGQRLYRDPPMSPSVSSMSSAPLSPLPREYGRSGRYSPELRRRSPEYDYAPRSGIRRTPREEDRELEYPRNPFEPRRESRPY